MSPDRSDEGPAGRGGRPAPREPGGRSRSERATPFAQRVFRLVRRVPSGQVVSYGDVAALLGVPRAARGVGRALSTLPPDSDVPWWRVVNRNGEISIKGAPGLPALQRTLLEDEGVEFDARGRISWERFGWK